VGHTTSSLWKKRPDVLLYTSSPLDKPLEITGRIKVGPVRRVELPITDSPPSSRMYIPTANRSLFQDGIIRAVTGSRLKKEELLTPDKAYRFEIDLWSSSIIVNKGTGLHFEWLFQQQCARDSSPTQTPGDPFRANRQEHCRQEFRVSRWTVMLRMWFCR